MLDVRGRLRCDLLVSNGAVATFPTGGWFALIHGTRHHFSPRHTYTTFTTFLRNWRFRSLFGSTVEGVLYLCRASSCMISESFNSPNCHTPATHNGSCQEGKCNTVAYCHGFRLSERERRECQLNNVRYNISPCHAMLLQWVTIPSPWNTMASRQSFTATPWWPVTTTWVMAYH